MRVSAKAAPTFGGRLRALREAAGLSQDELAERARVSTDAVSALERGTRARPYPATVSALADALGLSPQEHAALVAAVPRRRRTSAVSTSGRRPRAGSLPTPATPLLGRDADVAAVTALLATSSVRLVTLTGIGGIGKTRLAVAAAERIGSTLPDGAAFVALAPVLDEALVWPEVGRALGVEGAGRSWDVEEVLRAAASLEMLLVLDNCEHLPGAAGVAAELLDRCPGLALLVTSRAPLRVRAETEYLVPALGLPELGTRDLCSLRASPAATLLIERGRAVRRGLVVRAENVPALVSICHRLAGLPLALELAAAGLRILDPAPLLARLDEVLAQEGAADLPARQRTMRATLDWSYGLLSQRDQSAFRQLSVFVGDFTLEAAEAVVGGPDVLGAVDELVGQSLLTVASATGNEGRYGMLEPVAQYARSLLSPLDVEAAREAHARFFLGLAEQVAHEYRVTGRVDRLERLNVEDANLASAADWTVRTGRAELAGRFTWALWAHWWLHDRPSGHRFAHRVLSMDLSDLHRARTLVSASILAEPGTDPEGVESELVQALELAGRCGDHEVEAAAAVAMGVAELERRDPATAEQWLRRALPAIDRSEEAGGWLTAQVHGFLAAALRFQGDPRNAVEHSQRGLESARKRGDLPVSCTSLYNLAHSMLALGQYAAARERLYEAVELCKQTRDAPNLGWVLDALAVVEARTARPERVVILLGAAEAMREVVGSAVYGCYGPDVDLRLRTAEAARRQLGAERYRRAFDAGLSLTLDGAAQLVQRQVPRNS